MKHCTLNISTLNMELLTDANKIAVLSKSLAQKTEMYLFGIQNHTDITLLCEVLKANTTLTSLSLSLNAIDDSGAKKIAQALKNNQNITTLDLQANQIGDEGAQALAQLLKVNENLTSLNLSNNEIHAAGTLALLKALKANQSLTNLTLCANIHFPLSSSYDSQIKSLLSRNNHLLQKRLLLKGKELTETLNFMPIDLLKITKEYAGIPLTNAPIRGHPKSIDKIKTFIQRLWQRLCDFIESQIVIPIKKRLFKESYKAPENSYLNSEAPSSCVNHFSQYSVSVQALNSHEQAENPSRITKTSLNIL